VADTSTISESSILLPLRRLKVLVWLKEHVQPTDLQLTLFWSGLIGCAGGLASVGFRALTGLVHKGLTGNPNPSMVESFAHLSPAFRFLIPGIGGLVAGAILYFGMRWHGKVTTTDYMEAVVLGDGKISTRRSLAQCLSALFTIASGGSIGREGPLVQLSSLIASLSGRFQHWSPPRLRLIVGCGAAAGIASAYNAPIAGAVFVAEIVLGSMAMEMFGPLVFSSVIATLTVRAFLGRGPLYGIPRFQLNSSWEIIPYLLLGACCGLLAPWFVRLLRTSELLAERFTAPVYIKMCIGGFVVGALAIFRPEVCGNGYSAVSAILNGDWVWQTLVVILVFKVLATGATFGSGAVGGVFTPTLFVGASLGFLLGDLGRHIAGHPLIDPSACALVAMGAFLAAVTHAPIMAIIMIFELTLDYDIILPLMLACVVGYYISVSIDKRSIYADAFKRKGGGDYRRQLSELHVRDLMKPVSITLQPTARFTEIGEKFVSSRVNYLYVTDHGRFMGAVSLHDIKSYLNSPELAAIVIAGDVLRDPFPIVPPEASLADAMDRFVNHDGERLPVVNNSGEHQLLGTISKTDVILALAGSDKNPSKVTTPEG
jgi:CIC family chloride channel protein